MGEHPPGPGQTMTLPQGDLRLLHSDLARRLLTSTIPARFAYIARDGTPRVMPTWFHWTGEDLVMPALPVGAARAAPRRPARRATRQPEVAVTIDTEDFPPQVLLVRGRVSLTEVDGWCRSTRWRRTGTGRGGRRRLPHPDRSARHQDGPHRRTTPLGRDRRLPNEDAQRPGRRHRLSQRYWRAWRRFHASASAMSLGTRRRPRATNPRRSRVGAFGALAAVAPPARRRRPRGRWSCSCSCRARWGSPSARAR
jgi:hypothetical protein